MWWFILVSALWLWDFDGINSQNFSPPVLRLNRNWRIRANEPVGTVVTRVDVEDPSSPVTYSLVENDQYGPSVAHEIFRIDNKTGTVFVNSPLEKYAGQSMSVYVIGNDGSPLPAKSEVWINILDPTKPPTLSKHPLNIPPTHQIFLNRTSIPNIFNHPLPPPPPPPKPTLPPIETTTVPETTSPVMSTSTPVSPAQIVESYYNENYWKVAVIPVFVTISVLLLTGGILVLVFRKRICMGSVKTSEVDKQKESSVSVSLSEDPTITMQEWPGPRALNNRYEPWERDSTQQSSYSASAPNPDEKPDKWEYPRHRLKIFNILGEGAFGQVWRYEATDIAGNEGKTTVAVKTLKENATDKERNDLLAELEVMKSLEPHPNVVRLLGCCTDKGPVFVIMEYVSKGKLQDYLRNSRAERCYGNMHGESKTLTSRDLTSMVYQVARGMEYVSSKGIVHRDLAARNILITDDHTCKVADFGFARDVTASRIYERKSEGGLPIRWMAPESLYDNVYTVKSDIWSFGVLMWEIVTLGSTPYPGASAAEVMKKVRDGHRLEKPEHCRRELYNIMYYCWDKSPQERPTFAECVALVEKLLLTETDYIELDRFPDHSYYNMPTLSGEKL